MVRTARMWTKYSKSGDMLPTIKAERTKTFAFHRASGTTMAGCAGVKGIGEPGQSLTSRNGPRRGELADDLQPFTPLNNRCFQRYASSQESWSESAGLSCRSGLPREINHTGRRTSAATSPDQHTEPQGDNRRHREIHRENHPGGEQGRDQHEIDAHGVPDQSRDRGRWRARSAPRSVASRGTSVQRLRKTTTACFARSSFRLGGAEPP